MGEMKLAEVIDVANSPRGQHMAAKKKAKTTKRAAPAPKAVKAKTKTKRKTAAKSK